MVKRKPAGLALGEQLHRELPFREIAGLDGFEKVAPVEVGVGASDLAGFVPQRGLKPQLGPPMELDKGRISGGIDQTEAVDTKGFDHAQRTRQRAV